jgi:hypothetical protein
MVFAFNVKAQRVPDAVIDSLIKMYKSNSSSILDKSFLPNFNRAHPNDMMIDTKCYPGKKVTVVALLASKPTDWKFKVAYGNQEAPKTHQLTEFVIGGKTYWTNFIMTAFRPEFNDYSDACLRIFAYDGDAIDLPVYIFIFVYTP